MRLIILATVLVTFNLCAQNNCDSIEEISAASLSKIKNTQKVHYLKIRKDSIFQKISFKGGFKNIIIWPNECNTNQKSLKLDSNGLIIPTENMINSGICYCPTCVIRYSKLSLLEDLYIKVIGGSNLEIELSKKVINENIVWYKRKLHSGDKIRLDNISFVGGLAKFRAVSYNDLNRLFILLEKNREVHVEIQGHVNKPRKKNSKRDQELSNQRAKAVVDYLLKKGINKDRLNGTGYGNTKMIYPNAKTEYEMQFNRRVEILVK
jgi:outer membrane protein OmpA-like peptidoglycan-associated protein